MTLRSSTDRVKDENVESFKETVAYFWLEKGDPERFTGWDEAYCEKVWPEFLHVWKRYKIERSLLNAITRLRD